MRQSVPVTLRWSEVIEVPAFETLGGVDCSTSRCGANARATGRLVREQPPLGSDWFLELYCPDCCTYAATGSPSITALAAKLVAAVPKERGAIVTAWLRTRTDPLRPWRD